MHPIKPVLKPILSSLLLFLFAGYCGSSSSSGNGSSSGSGDSSSTVTLSGTLSDGVSLTDSTVTIVDEDGNEIASTSTDSEGNYSLDVDEVDLGTSVTVTGTSSDGEEYSSVLLSDDISSETAVLGAGKLTAYANDGEDENEVVLHLNPITDAVSREVHGEDLNENRDIGSGEQQTRGEEYLTEVIGGGLGWADFFHDPDFRPRLNDEDESASASPAGVLLYSLYEQGTDSGGIRPLLNTIRENPDNYYPFMEDQRYQVQLAAGFMAAGFDSDGMESALDGFLPPTAASRSGILANMQVLGPVFNSARQTAQSGVSDPFLRGMAMQGIATAMTNVLNANIDSSCGKCLDSTKFFNLVQNAGGMLQTAMINMVGQVSNLGLTDKSKQRQFMHFMGGQAGTSLQNYDMVSGPFDPTTLAGYADDMNTEMDYLRQQFEDNSITDFENAVKFGGPIQWLNGALPEPGLDLALNAGPPLHVAPHQPDYRFFLESFPNGGVYNISIVHQPANAYCIIANNNNGTYNGSDITNIGIHCFPAAAPDPTFAGGNGYVFIEKAANQIAKAVGFDSMARIVIATQVDETGASGGDEYFVNRLLPDGNPDPAFNTSGEQSSVPVASAFTVPRDIFIDPMDHIYVAGGDSNDTGAFFQRFQADGSTVDTGITSHSPNVSTTYYQKILPMAPGQFLIAGSASNGDDMFLQKIDGSYTADSGFDSGADPFTDAAYNGTITGVAPLNTFPMGTGFALCGKNTISGYFALQKFSAMGAPDPTYGGGDGVADTSGTITSKTIFDCQPSPDGKIYFIGRDSGSAPAAGQRAFIARLNPDGSPDNTFGTGGLLPLGLEDGVNDWAEGVSLAIEPTSGKLVVVGHYYDNDDATQNQIAIWRHHSNGDVDASFSTDGLTKIGLVGNSPKISKLAIDPDGRYVIVGKEYNFGTSSDDSLIMRILP